VREEELWNLSLTITNNGITLTGFYYDDRCWKSSDVWRRARRSEARIQQMLWKVNHSDIVYVNTVCDALLLAFETLWSRRRKVPYHIKWQAERLTKLIAIPLLRSAQLRMRARGENNRKAQERGLWQ